MKKPKTSSLTQKHLQAETAGELDALLKPAWNIMRKDKGREGKAEG